MGTITNDLRRVSIQTWMVLDQGNLVNPGIVVSKVFFLRLGLGYADQTKLWLQTASEGSKLSTLGWTEAFPLKIEGITSQFKCQAATARGLSEDINLGSGFLQRVSTVGMDAQLHFYPDGVSLQSKDVVVRLRGKETTEKLQP